MKNYIAPISGFVFFVLLAGCHSIVSEMELASTINPSTFAGIQVK